MNASNEAEERSLFLPGSGLQCAGAAGPGQSECVGTGCVRAMATTSSRGGGICRCLSLHLSIEAHENLLPRLSAAGGSRH